MLPVKVRVVNCRNRSFEPDKVRILGEEWMCILTQDLEAGLLSSKGEDPVGQTTYPQFPQATQPPF
jgi:hypothetical protein